MKKDTIYRAIPALALAATVGAPAGTALASTTTKHTYKGPTEYFRWGTVQVSVVVKSKKITNVKTTYEVHTDRSQFIDENALPQLKQEVLDAQSSNVEYVSGATDTSDAYTTSLQAAVKKAVKAKTLPTKALA
jgi:uncharacterized protein with FMN-binding domain